MAKKDSLWRNWRPSNSKWATRVAITGPSCAGERWSPVSSRTSRTAASLTDSPLFTPPPGVIHHVPASGLPGSKPCWSSTRPSATNTTRAAFRSRDIACDASAGLSGRSRETEHGLDGGVGVLHRPEVAHAGHDLEPAGRKPLDDHLAERGRDGVRVLAAHDERRAPHLAKARVHAVGDAHRVDGGFVLGPAFQLDLTVGPIAQAVLHVGAERGGVEHVERRLRSVRSERL